MPSPPPTHTPAPPPLQPFFDAMHRALRPGGVVCTQGESLWYHLDIIAALAAMCAQVFAGGAVQYAYTTTPSYPRCARALVGVGGGDGVGLDVGVACARGGWGQLRPAHSPC